MGSKKTEQEKYRKRIGVYFTKEEEEMINLMKDFYQCTRPRVIRVAVNELFLRTLPIKIKDEIRRESQKNEQK